MKLSEAIREGAKKFGNTFTFFSEDGTCGCAVGSAILLTCGTKYVEKYWDQVSRNGWQWSWFYEAFPIGKTVMTKSDMPKGMRYPPSEMTLGGFISHLHSNYGWTREAIAEWVEVMENKIEARNAKTEETKEIVCTPVVNGDSILKG